MEDNVSGNPEPIVAGVQTEAAVIVEIEVDANSGSAKRDQEDDGGDYIYAFRDKYIVVFSSSAEAVECFK